MEEEEEEGGWGIGGGGAHEIYEGKFYLGSTKLETVCPEICEVLFPLCSSLARNTTRPGGNLAFSLSSDPEAATTC